jgi:hypothetical protein
MQNSGWHIVSKLALIALLMASVSCEKEAANCLEGRGEQQTEVRDVASFTHLYVEGRINVRMIPDTVDYCVVTYGENGTGGILTEMEGETLSITEINACDWIREIDPLPDVEVHYSSMNSIFSQSAAALTFEEAYRGDSIRIEIQDAAGSLHANLQCEHVDLVVHTGATDVTLEGTCATSYIYNSGYGPVHAENLVSRFSTVHNNSTGDTYVRAWERVFIQIYQRGDIYVSGNPEIEFWNTSGEGQVFRNDP